MTKFLFIFGYESPNEWSSNAGSEADSELSHAVWVEAPNEQVALTAGRKFAENFVNSMFSTTPELDFPGWLSADYSHWIEHQPLELFSGLALETFQNIDIHGNPVA